MPDIVGSLIPPRLSAAPSSPVAGQIYYHTGAKELRYWDGAAWITPSTLEIGNAYTEAMAGNMTIAEISSGNVNEDHVWMENFRITGMADPEDDWDAATKAYVDAHAGGGGGTPIAESYVQTGDLRYTTLAASGGGWTKIAIGTIVDQSSPAPFTRNGDGTFTCQATGTYSITGSAAFADTLAAGARVLFSLHANGTGGTQLATDTGHASWPSGNVAWQGKLLAGDIISLYVWMDTNQGQRITTGQFGFAAAGAGAKGEKGDPGGTMGAGVFATAGPATSVTSAWKTMPLNALGSATIDPAGSFVQNADNSFSVAETGWYYVTANIQGTWGTAAVLLASINNVPNAEGFISSDVPGVVGGGPRAIVSGLFFLQPSNKIYATAWSQTAQNCTLTHFSAVRQGGPQGPKGDPGGTMEASHTFYGLACTVLANTWKAATPTLWVNDGDATNFSIVGNEVVVRDAGIYLIAAQGRAPLNSTRSLINVLMNDAALLGQSDEGAPTGIQPSAQMVLPIKVPAGARIRIEFYAQTAGAFIDAGLGITRLGGPKGDKGDTGDNINGTQIAFAMTAPGWVSNNYVAAAFTATEYDGDPGAYSVAASNKAVIVRDAGVYQININAFGGLAATRLFTRLLLNGSQVDYSDSGRITGNAGVGPTGGISIVRKIPAGGTLTFDYYCDVAAPTGGTLTIARVGGPKGDQGIPGAPLPIGGSVDEALVKTGSGYGVVGWARPKGTLIDVQRIYGNNSAYKVMTTGQRFTTVAAGTQDLALSYTPPVDCWWEVVFFLGILNKTDAAYHYAQPQIVLAPVDADGIQGQIGTKMQHSTVQTFEHQVIVALFRLAAGVAYQTYTASGFSGGTWQYHQGYQQLSLTAKAFSR